MKKQPRSRKKLSRPVKTFLYIFVILLCVAIAVPVQFIPSHTPEIQFRRLEKGHMIGPSTILGTESICKYGHRKLIIAETDTELVLYDYVEYPSTAYKDLTVKPTDLMIRKKQGKLTILAAGTIDVFYSNSDFILPIILYDDYPEAVRAEIEFYLTIDGYTDPQNPDHYDHTFRLNAKRSNEGYFYFPIEHPANSTQLYTDMLKKLWSISDGDATLISPAPIPVTVRLYDEDHSLIADEVIYFHPLEDDFARP